MTVVDFKAAQKWRQFPKMVQKSLVGNVFCSKCGVTTIVDYNLEDHELGVLLKGKCKTCGEPVARLVELD